MILPHELEAQGILDVADPLGLEFDKSLREHIRTYQQGSVIDLPHELEAQGTLDVADPLGLAFDTSL
jgi:hypothetical protein